MADASDNKPKIENKADGRKLAEAAIGPVVRATLRENTRNGESVSEAARQHMTGVMAALTASVIDLVSEQAREEAPPDAQHATVYAHTFQRALERNPDMLGALTAGISVNTPTITELFVSPALLAHARNVDAEQLLRGDLKHRSKAAAGGSAMDDDNE